MRGTLRQWPSPVRDRDRLKCGAQPIASGALDAFQPSAEGIGDCLGDYLSPAWRLPTPSLGLREVKPDREPGILQQTVKHVTPVGTTQ